MKGQHSFEKPHWRKQNLRWLLGTQRLVGPPGSPDSGRLLCSYVEMVGETGIEMYELLRPHLIRSSQFIAVDNDMATLTNLYLGFIEKSEAPTIVKGDIYRVAKAASEMVPHPAAMFNFDTTNVLGEGSLDDYRGSLVADAVRRAMSRMGSCSLILNHVLDRGRGSNSQRLAEHSKAISRYLTEWHLTSDRLMGDRSGAEALAEDRDYVGKIGAYDVYRSERPEAGSDPRPRHLRMATLRMRFQANGVRLEIES